MGADRLRPLWEFSDIDASEQRLRAALAAEPDEVGRAEVLTQLARVAGLRARFDEAHSLLAEAEQSSDESDVVHARVLLERGRLLRLAGDPPGALPLFEQSFAAALRAGQDFIAADAAHMAALAGDMPSWTKRGLALAERSPAAAPWIAMLLNNLGWWHFERREYPEALATYRRSLEAHERAGDKPYLREVARCGVAKALRALGRTEEAVPLLEQTVAWADEVGRPDRVFHEELGAAYADVGRNEQAEEQQRLARLAGPGQLAIFENRPAPPRSDPGS